MLVIAMTDRTLMVSWVSTTWSFCGRCQLWLLSKAIQSWNSCNATQPATPVLSRRLVTWRFYGRGVLFVDEMGSQASHISLLVKVTQFRGKWWPQVSEQVWLRDYILIGLWCRQCSFGHWVKSFKPLTLHICKPTRWYLWTTMCFMTFVFISNGMGFHDTLYCSV